MQAFHLPFTKETPPALARRLARRAVARWQVPEPEDLLIVTTELMQNAIEHTSDGGELTIALTEHAILVEVADDDPVLPDPPPPDLVSGRGRGLHLVQAVARRWGTRPRLPHGKVVWAELPRTT